MRVAAKKKPPVYKGSQSTPKPIAQQHVVSAPVGGWVLSDNLTTPPPGTARILDNWICTLSTIRARGGSVKHATLDAAVTSVWSYKSGGSEELFCATDENIFDISSSADIFNLFVPTSSDSLITSDIETFRTRNSALSASITGQGSGNYSTQQFGTAGGDYQYACNGTDAPLLYDGSSFTAITGASSPAITGVTTSGLSQVWSFASRLFFVESGTQKAWYLGVDSIGGPATAFSLAGIFKRGGSLLFGARWSIDAGDGMDDKCVFVSTEGEVAVYSGTNPASSSTWGLQGVYLIPPPLGKNASINIGGDLMIATTIGLIPLSGAIKSDQVAIEATSFSRNIAPHWQERAAEDVSNNWQMAKVYDDALMFVTVPTALNGEVLAVNLESGAWSRMTGWHADCMTTYAGAAYFGSSDRCVYQMDTQGQDAEAPYTCVFLGQSEGFGAYGQQKTLLQARPLLRRGSRVGQRVFATSDFSEVVPAPPSAADDYTIDTWDTGKWDQAYWDASAPTVTSTGWVAVGVTGFSIAVGLQMTFGSTIKPDVELLSIDATYSSGALVG